MTLRKVRGADVESTSLAARFVGGPYLADPQKAEQRLDDWLSDLAPDLAAEFKDLLARFATARRIFAGLAEASPYLFALVRADASRALGVLCCDPDTHLAQLIERSRHSVWTAPHEA